MNSIKFTTNTLLPVLLIGLLACNSSDDPDITIDEPATYTFERNGESTVSFDGQTERILMAEEIISAMHNTEFTQERVLGMFNHQAGDEDFSLTILNSSSKNVKSKTAASVDYFSANTTLSSLIRAEFDDWVIRQVDDVFTNWDHEAVAGLAGYIQQAGGGTVRYINSQGLELNQAFNKSLIGAMMVDQILNNYISTSVLDAGENQSNNNAGTVEEGQSYTSMEHKWDEAYGYVYGTSANAADPNATIGSDDSFLNKYIGRVEGDADFSGIADDIFGAFKLGRAAIVAGQYDVRDAQVDILREKISLVIAVRAVHYLYQGKLGLEAANPDMASVFHDLSEGYGFVYSLQFTRNPATDGPYFTHEEVEGFIDRLMGDGENGFWDVTPATLQSISEEIAAGFGITVEQAGS